MYLYAEEFVQKGFQPLHAEFDTDLSEKTIDPEFIYSSEEENKFREVSHINGFINNYRDIDALLLRTNDQLIYNGVVLGKMKTIQFYKQKQISKGGFGRVLYFFSVLLHRVFPKLNKVFYNIYMSFTKGRDQRISKTEILGRLIKNGFDIQKLVTDETGELFFSAQKKRQPATEKKASYWPIFRMKRVGRHGKLITVYKIRTMHPYAEYVQEYIRQQHGLENSGKFMNDFRVTSWGRYLRKCWLDELPMIINLLKGDIKLVGVRPISPNFLKLYPAELSRFRNKFKPGLIPPYYADLPGNFEEILKSEEKYLHQYEVKPLRTDLQYFFAILRNIVFRKARSK